MAESGGRWGTESARVLRRIAEYFRERAKADGTPVVQVRDASGDVEELALRIARMVAERRADPSAMVSHGPIVVEILGGHAPRRHRRASRAGAPQQETEAVAEAWEMWRQYADAVKRLEEAGQLHPKDGVVLHNRYAVERMQDAYRILHERFGVRAAREGVAELRERMRLVVDDATLDLEDAAEVAAFADAWWNFRTMDDARVALNRALEEGRRRGKGDEETARAACEAVIDVLRSRPMLYGVFTLVPDWLEAEPPGLQEARVAATTMLAGWVRSQLRLEDWFSPSGKVGTNRLREALEEMAGEGERAEDVLLRELPTLVLLQTEELLRDAKADPEWAVRKLEFTSLRNRVANRLIASISTEGKLRREGKHVAENEADAELALTAHQQTAAAAALDDLEAAAKLSPQQAHILKLLREGKTNPEIAAELSTSTGTVEKQKSLTLRKMREASEAAGF